MSVSHTTRPRRPKELDGVNYHFVNAETFGAMVEKGAFLEHAEVFGNRYGTSRTAVGEALTAGADVVLEIDWQGAALRSQALPEAVEHLHRAPFPEALRERLQQRAQDDPAVIETRLAEARGEMQHMPSSTIWSSMTSSTWRLQNSRPSSSPSAAVSRVGQSVSAISWMPC